VARGAVPRVIASEGGVADLQFGRRRQEDPVYRAWQETQDWLARYGRMAGIAVLALALAGAAYYLWNRGRVEREGEASVRLAQMRALYWRADYPAVVQQARTIESEFAGTRAAAEATRVKGDALYWQGDFKGAITAYEEYLTKIDARSPALAQVRESLAQALENDGQYERAARMYEEIAVLEGPREILAARWLGAGRAWQLAGDREQALAAYRKVVREYAETASARTAQVRLGEAGELDS
jgi:tetratricopeptide (TPR) repeat protein